MPAILARIASVLRKTLYNKCCRVMTERRDRKVEVFAELEGFRKHPANIYLLLRYRKMRKSISGLFVTYTDSQAGLNRPNRAKAGKEKAWN